MNRRKALKIAGILGAGATVAYLGNEFYFKSPNVESAYMSSKLLLVAELVECIIPQTDTPGAKEALVHNFVINVIQNCTSQNEQKRFWNGLDDLESYCTDQFDKQFIHCSENQKNTVVAYFEKRGRLFPGLMGKIERKIFGQPFFALLKNYTINGYCISFLGATQNFRYDAVPMNFSACIPYTPGTPSWATK